MSAEAARTYLTQTIVAGVTTGPAKTFVASVCTSCGCLVMSVQTHDKWHDDMNNTGSPDDVMQKAKEQFRSGRIAGEKEMGEILTDAGLVAIAWRILEHAETVQSVAGTEELMWAYRQFPPFVHEAVGAWRGKPIVR